MLEEHIFIGTAAHLLFYSRRRFPRLWLGAGAAAIGGLISDIDVGTSQAHRDADKITTATVAVAVLTILAGINAESWNLPPPRDSSVLRLPRRNGSILLICAYGKQQPHNGSFMHSFARWHC